MTARLVGPTCGRCCRDGHNPPVFLDGLCSPCWRLASAGTRDLYRGAGADWADDLLAEIRAL